MIKFVMVCVLGWIAPINFVHSQGIFFNSKEISSVFKGQSYQYQFAAFDSAGNSISYKVGLLPRGLKYDLDKHIISGKIAKAGQYPIKIEAKSRSGSIYQHFMLTVHDSQTSNILCLGNSLTNGVDKYNSYRRILWQLLHKEKYNFDFIGSWSKHHMGGEMPNADFDMDHEGHSGWTLNDILNTPAWDTARGKLDTWLESYSPDIVLIELGTNDAFQCRKVEDMITDYAIIIKKLRDKNPQVTILAAQIPPLGAQWSDKKLCGIDIPYSEVLIDFNKKLAMLASSLNQKSSPVIIVDQFSGVDPAIDMFDDIHPNEKGEQIMAERWFSSLQNI